MTGRRDALTLWYLYDAPLPNRHAAGIQILRTGAAFAAAGARFVHLCGPVTGTEAEALAQYGLAPRDGFEIRAFFPSRRLPARLRDWLIQRGLRRIAAGIAAAPGRNVVMTRGETGIAVLPMLRRAPHGRSLRLVHEMHCLNYLRDAEKRLGRSLGAADLPPQARAERLREQAAVRMADALVYLTPQVAQAARAEFGLDAPALILPSGAEPAGRGAAVAPEFDLVYAGKIETRKGVRLVCEAMRFLPGRRLAIAGGPDAAAADLRAWVAAQGLADRISVLGLLAPVAVDGFLARGRVGVCPMTVGVDSVADRFTSPIKLMQMMGRGMAIVASDVPPVRAVAEHGLNALLAPPDEPAAFAAAAERLLTDADLAARLGDAALRTSERYSWDARAGALHAFLDVLTRRAADAAA